MKSAPVVKQSPVSQDYDGSRGPRTVWARHAFTVCHAPAQQEQAAPDEATWPDRIFQAVLWLCVIVTVAVITYSWVRSVIIGQYAVDWVALVIRLVLVGSLVLIVETLIEIHVMPWRFLD